MQKSDSAGVSVDRVDIYQTKGDMLYVESYKEINTAGCEKHCTGIRKEICKTGELAALLHGLETTALNETYAVQL